MQLLKALMLMTILGLLSGAALCQQTQTAPSSASSVASPATPADDYSGMYTFLREGEFVQITVEDAGHVTGFVSRFGDTDSDHGAFLNHFFKQGKLDGHDVSFTTETVHGTWFEFKGKVDRGPAKTKVQEGYYVVKGTLTESSTDAAKKVSSKSREVEFKLFPADAEETPAKHD